MHDGPTGLPRTESHAKAEASNRLSVEEDFRIAAQIQDCFEGCVSQLHPSIEVLCHCIPGCNSDRFAKIAHRATRRVALDGNGTVDSAGLSPFESALRAEISEEFPVGKTSTSIPDDGLRQFSIDADPITKDAIKAARALANKLVVKFQPLAISIARLFKHTNIPMADLRQEAFLGLRRAALSFERRDGSGFSTYARTVIRNHLTSFVRSSMGTTEHYARRIEEFRKAEAELVLQGDPHPSSESVFDRLGWSAKQRENLQNVLRVAHQMRGRADVDIDQVPEDADLTDTSTQADDLVLQRQVLSGLAADDQLLLASRYSGMSFPEIAEQLHQKEHQVRLRHNELLGVIAVRMQQGNNPA